MNKCFITKLPSSVDNDNLPIFGQLRINWSKQSNLTNDRQRFVELATTDSITVKVSGAHFTDSTLSSNLGNTKTIKSADRVVGLYVSNDADAVLTIDNKYSLTRLSFYNSSVKFDINDIRSCTALTRFDLSNAQVSGNISALSNLTALIHFGLSYTQVSGNISALSNLTNLTSIDLSNVQVSGNISALSNLTNLSYLNLSDTQVSGKIDSLANLTKLTNLINLKGLSLTGDMSKIPAGVNFIAQNNRKVTTDFTWTANSRKNATLLAMSGPVPFDTTSMDNMLVDQATCTFKPTDPWTRGIIVSGTRTSASDAAVATLQNMGVTITGVTKVS